MERKDYWVYMVQCSDNKYYIGITNHVQRRVRQHNEGINPGCWTYKRRPVSLVYTAHFEDVHEAISWEKHIKRWSRKKKEALIKQDEVKLRELAACKNESHFKIQVRLLTTRDHVMVRLRSP